MGPKNNVQSPSSANNPDWAIDVSRFDLRIRMVPGFLVMIRLPEDRNH